MAKLGLSGWIIAFIVKQMMDNPEYRNWKGFAFLVVIGIITDLIFFGGFLLFIHVVNYIDSLGILF